MEICEYGFKEISDERGCLVALESGRQVPFEIKRVYYMYNLSNSDQRRGVHAHRELRQVIVPVCGEFTLLLDDGHSKKEIKMDSPAKGVLIDRMIWHELYGFSNGCTVLVLAGDFYDESDYIRDYDEFMKLIQETEQSEP